MEVLATSLYLPLPCSSRELRPRKACIALCSFTQHKPHKASLRPHNGTTSVPASRPAATSDERASMKTTWPLALVLGVALLLHPQPDVAYAFDWFGSSSSTIQKDPVQPFTLYGSVFKKYFIENIVEGKIVSRRKGFTSTACVNALDADKETPELQGVPAGLKVLIIGEPLCARSEGQTRDETSLRSCKIACTRAIARHLAEVTKETGYVLDSKDTSKVVESCNNQCTNECVKPGKASSFIFPFRPSK